MKRLLRKLEAALAAAAFAEEGDADTARRIVAEAEQDAAPGDRAKGAPARRPVTPLPAARRARGA
jgi:hypothetical protein